MPDASRPVVIQDYDPAWPEVAARLGHAIDSACGDAVLRVEHIGSTSVPGLAAKPIIDLMPVLARFDDGRACVDPMTALGYDYRGEYGIPGRHYFTGHDAQSNLAVHVHMLVQRSQEYRKHLLFRDYLRTHPATARAYEDMKREMAARYGDDRDAYTESKTDFVLETVARAEAWRGEAWDG
jgi:GrpB-like predicted nucleotidyltransferase (UPF0157 family)